MDEFLVKKTKEMALFDNKMEVAIDKRFLIASLWSASEYATCQELTYKEYKKFFKTISSDKRFRAAYATVKDMVELDKGIHLIYMKKSLFFFHYSNCTRDKLKGAIYTHTPRMIKNIYRKLRK